MARPAKDPGLRSTTLRALVLDALRLLGRPRATLSLVLADDDLVRALNRDYRESDKTTDVLSFGLAAPEALVDRSAPVFLGEIYISVETARRQARALGHSLREELDLLCCHACLHLIGYDDRDPLEARMMHAREMDLLGRLYERPARTLHVGA